MNPMMLERSLRFTKLPILRTPTVWLSPISCNTKGALNTKPRRAPTRRSRNLHSCQVRVPDLCPRRRCPNPTPLRRLRPGPGRQAFLRLACRRRAGGHERCARSVRPGSHVPHFLGCADCVLRNVLARWVECDESRVLCSAIRIGPSTSSPEERKGKRIIGDEDDRIVLRLTRVVNAGWK